MANTCMRGRLEKYAGLKMRRRQTTDTDMIKRIIKITACNSMATNLKTQK